jgi:hypothetical protein
MPTLIPDRLTPISEEDAIRAFADGWSVALRADPSPRQLAIIVAHVILENAAGFTALHWWNFGNVKASAKYPGNYCTYRCNEVIAGQVRWFDPPHPATWFRAYGSAAEGAEAHVRFLAEDSDGDGKNYYAPAWARLLAGDADGFVRTLSRLGYFTGPVDAYARAVMSIAARIEPACARILSEQHPAMTDEDRAHINQQVAIWQDAQAREMAEPFPLPDKDIA